MTLVSLIDPADVDPVAAPALESGMAQYGSALNTWRALLHRPAIFAAYLPYLRAVAGPGALPPRVKELSALAVALANRCRYSVSHRTRAAERAGVGADEIQSLARDELDRFAPAERLAIVFARQLTLRPPSVPYGEEPRAVDGDILDSLKSTFSDAEIVELTASVALWNALTRFHRVMDLPLDMPAPAPAVEAVL